VQQLLGVVTLFSKGNADTGRELDPPPPEAERQGESLAEASRDALHQRFGVEFVAHDDELVAREASEGVARSKHCLDPSTDSDQELIARLMPRTVVDLLELVEVDEEHGDGLARTPTREEGMFDALEGRVRFGSPVRES